MAKNVPGVIPDVVLDPPIYVRISDPAHPHYPETGRFTGEIVTMVWGARMAKVKLDVCAHGTDACFVSPKQVTQIPPPKR